MLRVLVALSLTGFAHVSCNGRIAGQQGRVLGGEHGQGIAHSDQTGDGAGAVGHVFVAVGQSIEAVCEAHIGGFHAVRRRGQEGGCRVIVVMLPCVCCQGGGRKSGAGGHQ